MSAAHKNCRQVCLFIPRGQVALIYICKYEGKKIKIATANFLGMTAIILLFVFLQHRHQVKEIRPLCHQLWFPSNVAQGQAIVGVSLQWKLQFL